MCPFMETFTDTQDTPQDTTSEAPADLAPPVAQDKAKKSAPVDNSADADESEPGAVAQQEMADADLPRDIKPGAMGGDRALLMQLLGLDVNHPFDDTVEEEIRRHVPSYDGTVNKQVWRELYQENSV